MSVLKCLFVLCAFFVAACGSNDNAGKIPVKTFFKPPETSTFRISPDGKYLSFLKDYEGKRNIFIKKVNGDSLTQITFFTKQSVKEYYWAGSSRLVLVIENQQYNNYQMFTVAKDGKELKKIEIKPTVTTVEFIGNFKYADHHVLFAMNERNPEVTDVYSLNVITGERKLVEQNPGNFLRWITDDKNTVRLAVGSDGITETLFYRENADQPFKVLKSCVFQSTLIPIGFMQGKNHHIYAISNMKRDKLALVEFDCLSGEETRVIYENPKADIFNVGYSKTLNSVAYANTALYKREVYFLSDTVRKIYEKIRKQFKDEVLEIIDHDSSENLYILSAYTDKMPGTYYLYNIKEDLITKIGDVNPDIVPDDMCEMKPISYKSRDGYTLYGYLTLPKRIKNKKYPLIVMPHQGPHNRDLWGFNSETQFLANRGYAVLQVNFRGSIGYGKEFFTAAFKQWGKNVQNDITDGVKWLIKQDIVDAEKIAVYGYDFGGYSAFNQVIQNPELYSCAVSYSGFINLFTYIKSFPAHYKPYTGIINAIVGDPEKDTEYLKQSSPIFQAADIKVPVMIFQGAKDPKVNVNETNQFVKELRKNKQEVSYILDEDEGHCISDMEAKVHFYQSMEVFLDKHLNKN